MEVSANTAVPVKSALTRGVARANKRLMRSALHRRSLSAPHAAAMLAGDDGGMADDEGCSDSETEADESDVEPVTPCDTYVPRPRVLLRACVPALTCHVNPWSCLQRGPVQDAATGGRCRPLGGHTNARRRYGNRGRAWHRACMRSTGPRRSSKSQGVGESCTRPVCEPRVAAVRVHVRVLTMVYLAAIL